MNIRAGKAWFESSLLTVLAVAGAAVAGVTLIGAAQQAHPALTLPAIVLGFGGPVLFLLVLRNAAIKRARGRGEPSALTGNTFGEMRSGARVAAVGLYRAMKWLLVAALTLALLVLAAKGLWFLVSGVWSLG